MTYLKKIALAGVLAFTASTSYASTVDSCDEVTTNPGWDACEILDEGHLFGELAYDFNEDELFGHSDWEVLVEEGSAGGVVEAFAFPTGDYDTFALLLKTGNGVLGLLYSQAETLSSWMQGSLMVTEISQDVSGYILLGRGEVSPVPLPAAGFLLLGGLGGLVLAGRRRKSA